MFGNPPVFLSPISNREDLLLKIGINDDDTGEPINLSYCVTASGLAFSGSAWTVTVGALAVPSSTPLTIPVPPIGNELAALTLTVPHNLAIAPGDPVKIIDAAQMNYMIGTVTSYTKSTGVLVCQIGNTFQFEIRRQAPRGDVWTGAYSPWGGFGTIANDAPLITAALGTGVMIADLGVIQVLIPESVVRRLYLNTFGAYMTAFDGTSTRQVFIANLPVLYGGVTV